LKTNKVEENLNTKDFSKVEVELTKNKIL